MKTVMFIDDDQDFLAVQKVYFKAKGYNVVAVESGDEAMDALENITPDIIFLDLMMEHTDSGFTLGHRLRKIERLRDTPMIMLSGVASATGKRFDGAAAELRQWSKLDGFVDKPVEQEQLLKIVRERTEGSKS